MGDCITILEDVYKELMSTGFLPDSLWDEWLWKTDPEEAYMPDVLMNRSQLLGFMVCLCKGIQSNQAQSCESQGGGENAARAAAASQPPSAPERLVVMSKGVESMSLRELKDTVENLQIEWPAFISRLEINPHAQANLEAVISLIDQCAARFGVLCLSAFDEDTMDDLGAVEPSKDTPDLFQLTAGCVRRMISTFLIVYRHLYLLAVCENVPSVWRDLGITKYHVEASSDDFNMMCMHLSLPVAAKLNYRHDFPGMYNHVSQVVFFHNNDYQRIARADLKDFREASAAHVLPALMQLYPDIGLKYEEDQMDLSEGPCSGREAREQWFWLVVAGRVYLVGPGKKVYYSPDVTSLMGVYLDKEGGAKQ